MRGGLQSDGADNDNSFMLPDNDDSFTGQLGSDRAGRDAD